MGAVEVRIEQRGREVRLAVQNDGEPIAPEVVPRLFERFYRAEQDRSHSSGQGEGSGLGLAITQAIVQAHGGRIQARGLAEGNVFEIFLPVIDANG